MSSESHNQIKKLGEIDEVMRKHLNEALYLLESLSEKYNRAFGILFPEIATGKSIETPTRPAAIQPQAQPVVPSPDATESPSSNNPEESMAEFRMQRYEEIKSELLKWYSDIEYPVRQLKIFFNLTEGERVRYFNKLKQDKIVSIIRHGWFKVNSDIQKNPKKDEAPKVNGKLSKDNFFSFMVNKKIVGKTSGQEIPMLDFWSRFEHIGTEVEDLMHDKNSYFKIIPR